MKPTGTSACRPTAASIARSFAQGNKRHLLITGGRGSGKTTLLGQLLPLLWSGPIPGLTSWREPGRAVYLRENTGGPAVPIGRCDARLPGQENRMRPVPGNLAAFGAGALAGCAQGACPWFSMDEIGYLETSSPEYCRALLRAMGQKRLAAVVRKQDLPFLNALKSREDVWILDLDRPFAPLGCVIMASGQGRRFGGNKLMADFGGRPMLARMLDATAGVFPQRVVVTRSAETAAFCRACGVPVLRHNLPLRSDTVRLGLEAAGAAMAGCMFCPGDQPLLTPESVQTLALCAAHGPNQIWQLAWGGRGGAPVLFPRQAFQQLRQLPKGRGGSAILQKNPGQVRLVPAREQCELWDVDSHEDLQKLLHYRER